MLQKKAKANACAFSFLALAVALMNANQATAQDKIQAKVLGFPVKAEDLRVEPSETTTAKLGNRVTVKVEPLRSEKQPTTASGQTASNTSAGASSDKQSEGQAGNQGNNPSSSEEQSWIPGLTHAQVHKLVPYLNARPLKGLYPETVDPISHTLTFHLERTQASDEAWTDLLSNPGFKPRAMTFSVGLEDRGQFDTVAILNLVVIPTGWFIAAIAILFIVLYVFFRLAARTPLLRDQGASEGNLPGWSVLWKRQLYDPKLGPFSLARCQIAFWFFLVIGAFVLIWMVIDDTDTITPGVLVLIGISAGTTLGATAIDASKRKTTTESASGEESRGWLNDILSDGTRISFHRFQIVVWTLVLGFVFVRNVWGHLAMPDFSTNLLTLMGISSGTYLGLKLPEQQAPGSTPTSPP